jgi:hypothetical protein
MADKILAHEFVGLSIIGVTRRAYKKPFLLMAGAEEQLFNRGIALPS